MATDLTALENAVTAIEGASDSAEALIVKIAALYAAAKTDPVRIQALSDRLTAEAGQLAAAVVAHDPDISPPEPDA